MWRSYCPHGGYAIGFPYHRLVALRRAKIYLAQCLYKEDDQRDEIRRHLTKADGEEKSGTGVEVDPAMLRHEIAAESIRLKDIAYDYEQEFRLIRVLIDPDERNDDDLKDHFRSSSGRIVPYVELRLNDDELWEGVKIVVGPSRDDDAIAVAKKLVSRYLPVDVDRCIEKSPIEFRYM
jgi:hypothetical protein